jgi:hypothetical protein
MISAQTASALASGQGVVLPISDQIAMLAFTGRREVEIDKKNTNFLNMAILRMQTRWKGYKITENPLTFKIEW